jgi:hypothetical protein
MVNKKIKYVVYNLNDIEKIWAGKTKEQILDAYLKNFGYLSGKDINFAVQDNNIDEDYIYEITELNREIIVEEDNGELITMKLKKYIEQEIKRGVKLPFLIGCNPSYA